MIIKESHIKSNKKQNELDLNAGKYALHLHLNSSNVTWTTAYCQPNGWAIPFCPYLGDNPLQFTAPGYVPVDL